MDFLTPKFLFPFLPLGLGVSAIAGSESNPVTPESIAGWGAIIAAIASLIWNIIDRRRVSKANADQEIIKSKNDHIAYLTEELENTKKEFKNYRQMHHDYLNEVQSRMLQNAAYKAIMSEKDIQLPAKIDEIPPV